MSWGRWSWDLRLPYIENWDRGCSRVSMRRCSQRNSGLEGYVLNFGQPLMKDGITRVINGFDLDT